MTSENGSRPEIPSARLDTFPSKMQAWGETPRALSEIAEASGFSMSDVAFISGLEESTVSRLWDNLGWLDKISGRSLQALIASVPQVGAYVAMYSTLARRQTLISELATEGLVVDESAIERCVKDGIPEQYLATALQSAVHIMRGDGAKASSYLARFWGKGQDRALTTLFSSSTTASVLKNPEQFLAASAELAPHLVRKAYSFHAIITQAVFAHYLGKATGRSNADTLPQTIDRQTAFTFRSSVMGLLISGHDTELAERYHRTVSQTPVLRTIEEWSFPTFTRDTRPNSDFSLPRSLLLRNTAAEILNEMSSGDYSDAYVYYLTTTYLPVALERDPTFGLRSSELASALMRRRDRCDNAAIRAACEALAEQIRRATP